MNSRRIFGIVVVLAVGTISLPSSAQTPPPAAQQDAATANTIEHLNRQVEVLETELQKTRERIVAENPQAIQLQKQLEAVIGIQKRVQDLSQRGELKEGNLIDVASALNEINRYRADQSQESSNLQEMKKQLAKREMQLAEREKQLATAAKQLTEERRPPLPALDNGTIKVYRFMYAQPRDAAKTVESLFGTQSLRLAVDERSNSLLVYGRPDTVSTLDALLTRLDEQASPDGAKPAATSAAAPRSLLLRVFWLADLMPETVGQAPTDFLPMSVLEAVTEKLGLEAPRLVAQSATSLATNKDEPIEFSANVPAVLLEQPAMMSCSGKLKLVDENRARMEMGVQVGGPAANCDLRGSMATPLGHYMVLGTANSMIAEGGAMMGGPGGPGMGLRGREMRPGGRGEFGEATPAAGAVPGGFGPEGGAADPSAGLPGAEGGAMPGKPNYRTSRFAFVVQVIDGQSYEPAKPKSKAK
jgi:hypothetical protein